MTKEITRKEREHILMRTVFILFIFSIVGFLITAFIPKEERFLPFSAMLLLGIIFSGIYASKKFARRYEELIWGVATFTMFSILFGGFVYSLYLNEIDVIQLGVNLILYMFLLWLPISIAAGFFAYEILSSRKIKKSFSFHVKRFTGRMVTLLIAMALFSAIYIFSYFVLSLLISEKYALIFTLILWSLVFYIILTRFKHVFSRLDKGEW